MSIISANEPMINHRGLLAERTYPISVATRTKYNEKGGRCVVGLGPGWAHIIVPRGSVVQTFRIRCRRDF